MRRFFENTTIGRMLLFVFSSVSSALIGTLAWELITGENENGLLYVGIVLVLAFCIMILGSFFVKRKPTVLQVDVGSNISHKSHVVTGLSWLNWLPDSDKERDKEKPSNLRLIINLVNKHQPKLKNLYLIDSKASGVQQSREAFEDWYKQNFSPSDNRAFKITYITVNDGYDMNEVHKKLKSFLQSSPLPMDDTLLDVTAGTAAMSAGMTMAALELGYSISYQATEHTGSNEFKNQTRWQYFENKIRRIYEIYPPTQ